MPISSPEALKFSNERVRPAADRLARAYYLADAAKDRWNGLSGTTADKIVVMGADIRSACDQIYEAFLWAFTTEKVWFLGINAQFPNTSEEVSDGSPADSRPANTGAKVNAVLSRAVEFQNWLLSTDGSFTNGGRAGLAYLNTVLAASSYGAPTLSEADAGNAINRFGELAANYEASTNANLNSILTIAVNPRA